MNNTPALQIVRLALAGLSPDERRALLAESSPQPKRILTRAEVAQRFNRTQLTSANYLPIESTF